MFLGIEQKEGYPATVKIVEENSSLVVYISLKATWGTLVSPDLCSFYDEFRKNVKQAFARTEAKQPLLSSQKLPEGEKECSPPPPSLPPSPPPSSSPPPAMTQKTSPPPLPQGKIIWVHVNLREGPGIHYKIIGRAYMKNTFEILDENPSWLRVQLENGTVGWMSKRAISESSNTPSSESPRASSHDPSKTKFSSKAHGPM